MSGIQIWLPVERPDRFTKTNLQKSDLQTFCNQIPTVSLFKYKAKSTSIQARIAKLVVYQLSTGEVPGSNPAKGENFSVKISNWIV